MPPLPHSAVSPPCQGSTTTPKRTATAPKRMTRFLDAEWVKFRRTVPPQAGSLLFGRNNQTLSRLSTALKRIRLLRRSNCRCTIPPNTGSLQGNIEGQADVDRKIISSGAVTLKLVQNAPRPKNRNPACSPAILFFLTCSVH